MAQEKSALRQATTIAIIGVAMLSTCLTTLPIIFLHKSLVSPNMRAVLFYDHYPTLPNYTDIDAVFPLGTDTGAMLWQHFPLTVAQTHAVKTDHEFPLWNRYNSSGTTLIGQGQMMLGDPFNWLMWLVGATSVTFDMKFILLRVIFAASLGGITMMLTRNRTAAFLSAFSAPFIGYFMWRVNHPDIFTLCYSPLILMAWFKLVAAEGRTACITSLALWVVANWLVMNSGTVKEAYLMMLCLNAIGFTAFITARAHFKESFLTVLCLVLGTGVCFLMVTAPLWGEFLDALLKGTNIYTVPAVTQAPVSDLLSLIDNGFSFLRDKNYDWPALNVLVFSGVVWGIQRIFQEPASGVRSIAMILSVSSMLLMVSASSLMPAVWLLKVPFLNQIIHTGRTILLIAIVPLCVLAGLGFDYADKQNKYLYMPVGIFLGLVTFFCVYFHQYNKYFFIYTSLLVVALGLLPRLLMQLIEGKLHWFGIGCCIVLTVLGLGRGALWPSQVPYAFVLKPTVRVDVNTPPPIIQKIHPLIAHDPQRVLGVDHVLSPGPNAFWGLEAITGPDAMMDKQYYELTRALQLPVIWDFRLFFSEKQWMHHKRALDFLGVGIVFSAHPLQSQKGLTFLGTDQVVYAYLNHDKWPRAFYTDHLFVHDSLHALVKSIDKGSRGPFVSVDKRVVEQSIPLRHFMHTHPPKRELRVATDYVLTNNTTAFTIRAPAAGVVYIGEAGLPQDFIARINGKVVDIIPANHAFKALFIAKAGTYRIVLQYWPAHLSWYVKIALFGVGLWVLLLLVVSRFMSAYRGGVRRR